MRLKVHGIKFRFMFILFKLLTFKTIGWGGCIVTLCTKLLQLSVNHFVIAHFVSLAFTCLLWIMNLYSWICVTLFMSKKLHLICRQKTRILMCPTWMMVNWRRCWMKLSHTSALKIVRERVTCSGWVQGLWRCQEIWVHCFCSWLLHSGLWFLCTIFFIPPHMAFSLCS